MSESLAITVTDYWKDLDPRTDPLVRMILSSYDAVYVDDPSNADLVLFSVFGRRNGVAKGTRLGFSGEPRLATGGDWALDWRFVGSQRHLRYPYWVHHMLRYHGGIAPAPAGNPTKFCNFVYSNHGCGLRNALFTMLDRERRVDSPGAVFNNMRSDVLGARNDPNWPTKKLDFLADYRFTIAFENEEHVGYTTEKIVDAWLAGSVPIYWGNPAIEVDFRPGSFVSYYDARTLGALVETILALDDDVDAYARLADRNPGRTGELQHVLDRSVAEVELYVGAVVEDARAHLGRSRRSSAVRANARLRLSYADLRKRAITALLRR